MQMLWYSTNMGVGSTDLYVQKDNHAFEERGLRARSLNISKTDLIEPTPMLVEYHSICMVLTIIITIIYI